MRKVKILALLLALCLLLSSCSLIVKDMEVDRATEVIRVNDTVITKGEYQEELKAWQERNPDGQEDPEAG